MQNGNFNADTALQESTRRQRVARWCRRKAVLLIPAALVIYVGVLVARPPSVTDLSEAKRTTVPELLSAWQEGEVIVLLRHLERCDRADAPCLHGEESGITARAVPAGYELGRAFEQLGLANADISNSPLARTAQTSRIVFNREDEDQIWLYRCKDAMADSVQQRKAQGRNLILVTHSGCMKTFLKELGFDDDKPAYGTALFVSAQHSSHRLRILGFLDIEDWEAVLNL